VIDGIDPATLTWTAPEDPGCVTPYYDVVMTGVASDWSGATCVEESITATTATDFTVPSPGETIFYLVRSRNGCGDHLGHDSDLNPRSGAACAVLPKVLGDPCTLDAQCQSGFCSDGVCCQSACGGLCEICNLAQLEGLCEPVPDGQDAGDDCPTEDPSTCGTTGTCDGNRACTLYDAGTICDPAVCNGGTIFPEETCDGAGACTNTPSVPCDPFACTEDPSDCVDEPPCCLDSCLDDGHCAPDYTCLPGGECLLRDGMGCLSNTECASGFCIDGVCCESACGGLCEACNVSGLAGSCEPVPSGLGPTPECPGERCIGAEIFPPEECNGHRGCTSSLAYELCHPYICTTGAPICGSDPFCCRTDCTWDGHCAPGYRCHSSGTCRKVDGDTCLEDTECYSNTCCWEDGALFGFCRDLSTDRLNCGSCFAECVQTHGSNNCSGGVCNPVCDLGWGDCDGNLWNGCEQTFSDPDHCGGCGQECPDPPHATAGCWYAPPLIEGECEIGSCVSGWADCDFLVSNGCEIGNGPTRNSTADAIWVGEKCGDEACGFLCPTSQWEHLATVQDQGSVWFQARARECSACAAGVGFRVTLTPPAGSNFDLYVEDEHGASLGSSENPGDQQEVVWDFNASPGSSYYYWVKVVWVSGPPCATFTLRFDGRNC
jgi:hypothetical protein